MKKTAKPGNPERPPKKTAPAKAPAKAPSKPAAGGEEKPAPICIVGIGASAGGLEALEQFLSRIPLGSNLALVVIQHLDPTHQGIMPELLQRITRLKVAQAKDRTPVRPDCVYVIPANKDMSIFNGCLHLMEPLERRGMRLPVDFFFRSLADDQRERSTGVILSGMGTDGTLGVRAIKEKGGLVMVQEPASAKFDGMPRSAIGTGLVDLVAPATELPGKLLAYHRRAGGAPAKTELVLAEKEQNCLEKVLILLRSHTGNDFSQYKKTTLYRRIERRMGIHQISKIATYVRYVQENPQELGFLFKELLIGVTNFFRDPDIWNVLRDEALAALIASRPPGQMLRAWVPGCSTGEEAYSLAIVFKEALERVKPKKPVTFQIFATDLDRDAIEKARLGAYPGNIEADVSPERLARFFVRDEQTFRVVKEIREMIIFAPQNLIMDPPFTKLDVLCCRNLLIYLNLELQQKLLPLFYHSLHPGGVLLLGNAESIGGFGNLFSPLNTKAKIFQRNALGPKDHLVEFPIMFGPPVAGRPEIYEEPKPPANLQTLMDQLLVQRYSPPAVLVNNQGDILYIHGRTGKYLEPAAGKANLNIFAMAREGLRFELSSAFQQASRDLAPVVRPNLKVGTNGGTQLVNLLVEPFAKPELLRGTVLVVFAEPPAAAVAAAPPPHGAGARTTPAQSARTRELELELQHAREEQQNLREEMQGTNEELKSTNEELQSTNEELQSTNEELTTSKEELQSMNEELHTVNAELQSKVDDLSAAGNDMKNLLNSNDLPTVFLDQQLQVKRFSDSATALIKLIPGDVGRPFTDLTTDLTYPDLARDAREVLHSLQSTEQQSATRDGRWFLIRLKPYCTQDNRIDGVVITFRDVTAIKKLEEELRQAQAQLRAETTRRKQLEKALGPGATPPPEAAG